jgi:hypothetical protein
MGSPAASRATDVELAERFLRDQLWGQVTLLSACHEERGSHRGHRGRWVYDSLPRRGGACISTSSGGHDMGGWPMLAGYLCRKASRFKEFIEVFKQLLLRLHVASYLSYTHLLLRHSIVDPQIHDTNVP